MTPTLLLTRPEGRNGPFAAMVRDRLGRDISVVTSPLMAITFLEVERPDAADYVFTSVNGVAAAKAMTVGAGATAWCVGRQTAAAATKAGFAAKVGPGDADALVAHIIAAQPNGRLAHIRGRHSRGDVAQTLQQAGIRCEDIVAYDQIPSDLTSDARSVLSGQQPVVFPLFSPRTATILKAQGPFAAPIHAAAMSEAVKAELSGLPTKAMVVAKHPDAAHMADAVAAMIDKLLRD